MVQYMTTRLDTSFAALSDATRRGVLEQLGRADASITDLAEQFDMTFPPVKNRTTVERKSDREVIVTRTINGPARIVFEAFTKAELLKRWWVPKSMGMTLLSCEVDARVGGKYRLVFDHGGPEPAAFFGTYVE